MLQLRTLKKVFHEYRCIERYRVIDDGDSGQSDYIVYRAER